MLRYDRFSAYCRSEGAKKAGGTADADATDADGFQHCLQRRAAAGAGHRKPARFKYSFGGSCAACTAGLRRLAAAACARTRPGPRATAARIVASRARVTGRMRHPWRAFVCAARPWSARGQSDAEGENAAHSYVWISMDKHICSVSVVCLFVYEMLIHAYPPHT